MSASALLTAGLGGFGTVSRVVLLGLAPSAVAAPPAASRARAGGRVVETARRRRTTR